MTYIRVCANKPCGETTVMHGDPKPGNYFCQFCKTPQQRKAQVEQNEAIERERAEKALPNP